jgi:hypothetical protein
MVTHLNFTGVRKYTTVSKGKNSKKLKEVKTI